MRGFWWGRIVLFVELGLLSVTGGQGYTIGSQVGWGAGGSGWGTAPKRRTALLKRGSTLSGVHYRVNRQMKALRIAYMLLAWCVALNMGGMDRLMTGKAGRLAGVW